jgi:hypothetical protein
MIAEKQRRFPAPLLARANPPGMKGKQAGLLRIVCRYRATNFLRTWCVVN